MVFAFVTPRRCPTRKVTEIQTALRSSEHNHTHHRLSCSSLPTGQKLPKWSAFFENFLFCADQLFHHRLTKSPVPSGFSARGGGRGVYFRNFFYRLIFYSYRKVSTVTSTTFTPIEKALRIQGFQPLVTLDDGEIRKFSIGLFFSAL